MKTRRQDFVTFLSPGTLFSEQTTKAIDGWSTYQAMLMSASVVERYGARPYAFYFTTCVVAEPIEDGEGGHLTVRPREVGRSGIFHINGRVLTFDELTARADPSDANLILNMACSIPIVVQTFNSFRHTSEFREGDVCVNDKGEVTERGDTAERCAYRAAMMKKWNEEV